MPATPQALLCVRQLVCACGVLLGASAAAQTPMMEQDDIIPLLDTPLMQLPIEQGTTALTPPKNPQPPQPQANKPAALTSPADTRALCDTALDAIANAQAPQAFELLAPHWPLPQQEIRRLTHETATQLKQLSQSYGKLLGHEWVRTHTAGTSLVQHSYVLKLEHHALRVVCTFYKPQQHWQVHTVFWDDQLQPLLEP